MQVLGKFAFIEFGNQQVEEADLPGPGSDALQLDHFTCERTGDEELSLVPADAPGLVDIAGLAPGDGLVLARIVPDRSPVKLDGSEIAQRFVRPLIVSLERPPAPVDAKGGPLSERIAFGNPNS